MLDLTSKTHCLYCNKEIDKYQSHLNKKNNKIYYRKDRINKYCGQDCFIAHKNRTKLDKFVKCLFCDKNFKQTNRESKFCSQSCSGKFNNNCSKVKSWTYSKNHKILNDEQKKIKYYKSLNRASKMLKIINNCIKCNSFILNNVDTKYCSQLCKDIDLNKKNKQTFQIANKFLPIIHNCVVCNTQIINSLSKKYCSDKCHKEWSRKQWPKSKERHKKCRKERGRLRKCELISYHGNKCKICGYDKNIRAMTFHHRDPLNKKFTLDQQNLSQKKWEDIVEESNKCDLLCFNCHMEIHDSEYRND